MLTAKLHLYQQLRKHETIINELLQNKGQITKYIFCDVNHDYTFRSDEIELYDLFDEFGYYQSIPIPTASFQSVIDFFELKWQLDEIRPCVNEKYKGNNYSKCSAYGGDMQLTLWIT